MLLALAGYGYVYTPPLAHRPRARAATAPRRGWRLALWWPGSLALFVALVSPVDRLGEQFATAHMVQHLLLADVVPILLHARR